ncbi:MAG: hypothetical protein PCFJNLEI_02883 [Verrucomicrobiae bacterium]|nr:hypothetical protein [Verrucomicrobiae bacterium]
MVRWIERLCTARGRFKFVKLAIRIFIVSWVLTTLCAIIGALMVHGRQAEFVNGLPFYTFYGINLLFDLATVFTAYWSLRVITRCNALLGFGVLLVEAGIALCLYTLCWATMSWSAVVIQKFDFPLETLATTDPTDPISPEEKNSIQPRLIVDEAVFTLPTNTSSSVEFLNVNGFEGGSLDGAVAWNYPLAVRYGFEHIIRSIMNNEVENAVFPVVLTMSKDDRKKIGGAVYNTGVKDWYWLLVAGPTAIPTVLYLSLLFLCYVGKAIVILLKRFGMHLLELLTDGKPEAASPFLLLGTLADVLIILIKVVTSLRL